MLQQTQFDTLFNPKTVMIIGGCAENCPCNDYFLQHLTSAQSSAQIFVVTACVGEFSGATLLTKISDLPERAKPLDLAYVCLSAEATPSCLEELAKVGTKAVIISGAGFKETGSKGLPLEEKVLEIAKKHRILLIGPNSMGIMRPKNNLFLTTSKDIPQAGNIAFFSQSKTLGTDMLAWANQNNVGFSSLINLGNRALTAEGDILNIMADDPQTAVIVGYLEDIVDGQNFISQAHVAARKKPIVIMRPGHTPEGTRAASAHSGVLPSPDMAYEAVFRQTGIIRVKNMEELFATTLAFSSCPLPKGPGISVLTNSGTTGVITADAVADSLLCLTSLAGDTFEKLHSFLPSFGSVYNPIDIGDEADAQLMARAAQAVLEDPATHSLLIAAVSTENLDIPSFSQLLIAIARKAQKPIFLSLLRTENQPEITKNLHESGVACIASPDVAVFALEKLYRYSQWLESPYPIDVLYRRDFGRAQRIIQTALQGKHTNLTEYQAFELMAAYEMPMLETKLARTSEDAVQIARQMGESVVLKIASPHIEHKTESDGVRLGLTTPDSIRKAFLEITTKAMRVRKDAYIAGCLVQAHAPANSRELIMGFKRDKSFGAIVYFGLAGVHSSSYKDISCRIAPLSMYDAPAMVREINAFPRLAGFKGQQPIKFNALEDILLILSTLAADFPEVQEIECDPVLVNEDGAYIAGLRVLLDKESLGKTMRPNHHKI